MDTVEVRFRGSKGGQGRKGTVIVRIKGVGDKRGKAVDPLQELDQIHEGRLDVPLMAYQIYRGW